MNNTTCHSILYHNDQTEEELVGVKNMPMTDVSFVKIEVPQNSILSILSKSIWIILTGGGRMGTVVKENFAIKYEFEGEINAFYPDFIIGFTNETIGIFETKMNMMWTQRPKQKPRRKPFIVMFNRKI